MPDPSRPGREELGAMVLAACDYLAGLNTACSRTYRQFRPLIEARVQAELYELLLRCFEASPADGREQAGTCQWGQHPGRQHW